MKLRLFLFGLALARSISADGDSSLPFNIEPIKAMLNPHLTVLGVPQSAEVPLTLTVDGPS